MERGKTTLRPAFGRVLVALGIIAAILSSSAAGEEARRPLMIKMDIFDDIEGYPSHHAATIEELPGGDMMAAWYSGSYEKATDVAVFAARLRRGAREWGKPFVLHDTPGFSEGNPVLYTDSAGRVWFFFVTMFGDMWTDCKIFYKTSNDGGDTWSEKKTLRGETGWMTRNKPVELADGTMVLPLYDEIKWRPEFMLTRDGGETWTVAGGELDVPGGGIQPSVVVRDDGSLLAFLRTGEPGGNIWTIESDDGGDTWGGARRTRWPNPNAAVDAVNLEGGGIALVFNDSQYDRTPLNIALSPDCGGTWTANRKLEGKFGRFAYPAAIQDSGGYIHVVYTNNRKTIRHTIMNREWIEKEK